MDAPANGILSGPIASTFNAIPFDKSPSTCQRKKEHRKALGFQILHFDWSFSSDIMAVKGLKLKMGPITAAHYRDCFALS